MAVRIDVEAFRDSIPAAVHDAAARLRGDGGIGELESIGGGVQAAIQDGGAVFQPWAGIVDHDFTGVCDCPTTGDGLCAHAVAVALTAFERGVTFSGAATPPGADPDDPRQTSYVLAARRLAPTQLADLVTEHALRDRLLATRLLSEAGMLDAGSDSHLADFRDAIRDAANATNGEWDLHDVEAAGHHLVAEVEILCAHPATPAMLDLVEQAIIVWDELAGHLIDSYSTRRTDPDQISEPLLEAHRDLCELLDLHPDDVAERLTRLTYKCDNDTVDTTAHAHLLPDPAETD